MAEAGKSSPAGLHRFAVGVAVATLFLIAVGGLVTSTGSGLAVPDWPLSYGKLMPPMVGGVFYEHGHRMVAATVGLGMVILTIWLARREGRLWVRRLGYAAVFVIILQAVLGGLTVLFLLPTAISVAHACLAQIFFCLTVTIAVVTSRRWSESGPGRARSPSPLTRMAVLLAAVVFLQLLLGAWMRHAQAGLAIPDFPLSFGKLIPPIESLPVALAFAHRMGAIVVAACVAACLVQAFRAGHPDLKKVALLAALLVAAQIALGASTVLSRKAVPLATAHVATGALLLGVAVALSLSSLRAGQGHLVARALAGGEREEVMASPVPTRIGEEAAAWK